MSNDVEHPPTSFCPRCGQSVEIPREVAVPLQCPACGEQFIIDDEPADPEIEFSKTSEDELELGRIMQISKLRLATYRSRSHAIIAAIVCVVALVQLIFLIVGGWRTMLWS
jgi:predicted RNA-binding Zn-ribbon protein involved in translation (DUF1610 family)